jgi:hypothetical protein
MRTGSRLAMLVALTLLVSITGADANSSRKADLTKRQSQIADKRVPVKTVDIQKNTALGDKRMPVKMWHGEFNAIGQRRAPIEVRETNPKTRIRPEIIEVEKKERRIAPQSRRMAHVRNFDQVREKQLVPKYRDAEVGSVQQMSRPAPSKKQGEELTMRDLNRFSFQRNHPDAGGPKVEKAGSEQKN